MGQEHFWQVRPDDVASRRIDKMAAAIAWVRQDEDRYAVFGDTARADRYVQFAYGGGGTSAEATEATRVALPLLLAVAGSGRSDRGFTPDDVNSFTEVGPRLSTPYAGEPDHEPLLMEVGSGDWPKSSRQGLADDESVVAGLAAYGLVIGGSGHECRNFCRDHVTEPSEILAAVSEEIIGQIVHAGPAYRLTVQRGRFNHKSSPVYLKELS
jgi:hypothetical protein